MKNLASLIHGLIGDSSLDLTGVDRHRLLRHIARTDFNRRRVGVDPNLVGEEFQGRNLQSRESSLLAHLAKRAKGDRQWSEDTTEREFLADIKRVARHPKAEIAVYERRDTDYLAVAAPSTVPGSRRGPDSRDHIVVYYSASTDKIIMAYQTDDPKRQVTNRARWLK